MTAKKNREAALHAASELANKLAIYLDDEWHVSENPPDLPRRVRELCAAQQKLARALNKTGAPR